MPNPYTNFRNRQKSRGSRTAQTSKKVRVGSGGRRIRMVANRPIEKPTPTGTEMIETDEMKDSDSSKSSKKKKKSDT